MNFMENLVNCVKKNNIKQEYSRTGDKYKTSPIESFNMTVRSMFEKFKIIDKVNASNIFNVMKKINNHIIDSLTIILEDDNGSEIDINNHWSITLDNALRKASSIK